MDPQIQTMPQQTFSGISGGGEMSLYQYFIASPLFAEFNDLEGSERKIFLSQLATLSPPLRNFLASTDTVTTVLATALSYELDDNQTSKIAGSVRKLVLGDVFIKDFPTMLSSKLGIDDIKAGEIANKIISQSFGPIIEDVKRIQRSRFPDKISQIQKEAQPSELIQSTARPIEPRSTPTPAQQVQQPFQRPTVLPPTPPPIRPAPPVVPPPAPMRPPILQQSKPPIAPPPLPSMNQGKPPAQPFSSVRQSSPQAAQGRPFDSAQGRPEFKIPDLGQPVSSESNVNRAKQSLEEELEKVANVIDLRNKDK